MSLFLIAMTTTAIGVGPEFYINRARQLHAEGDVQAAVICADEAIRLDRRNPRLLVQRAYLNLELKRFHEGLADINMAELEYRRKGHRRNEIADWHRAELHRLRAAQNELQDSAAQEDSEGVTKEQLTLVRTIRLSRLQQAGDYYTRVIALSQDPKRIDRAKYRRGEVRRAAELLEEWFKRKAAEVRDDVAVGQFD